MNKEYLWKKLGAEIQRGLADPQIIEIMLNPDGVLWFAHRTKGNIFSGYVASSVASAFVHALAQYENKFLHHNTPYLDAILPFNGERINVTVPPITDQVSFNIRKKSKIIFTLADYVNAEILTEEQAVRLKKAIVHRKNILISGSPAAGKTTFANALLDGVAKTAADGHRVMLLEQVAELACAVKNSKRMHTSEHVSMNTLLWLCLRNSPDRIVVGEVRDGAALEMLKAWNTGCKGGVATIHANSAEAAIQRVLDLACEVVANPPYVLAAEALDVIVHIDACPRHPAKRVVTQIIEITGFDYATKEFLFKR